MAIKKITIVLIPDGGNNVKQIKIPKKFFIFSFLFFISTSLFLAWTIRDYHAVKTRIPLLSNLQEENKKQKEHLVALAQKFDKISTKMIELKKFDHKLKTMVNLESGEDNTPFLGIGGSDPTLLSPDYTIEKVHRKLTRLMHQTLDNLSSEISIQINEKAELHKFLENQKSMLICTPSIWPTKGWITSRFGYRISPFTNEREFHQGLDISNRINTIVISPANGIVSASGLDHGYGKIVSINHGYGLKSKYAHLSKILVKKGQYVKRGQKIAMLGNSGRTTGPHLHYEVHLNGVPVNPLRYILN